MGLINSKTVALSEFEDHGEQTDRLFRTRNFEASNEIVETGVPVKTREGKPVSAEWKQEECYQ